jgi:hypothetical protein
MVDLNGHEAGNGGHSQRTPTANRGSSTRNEYVRYYHEDRTHLALEKGTPAGRKARETRGAGYDVTSMPRLGGMHHRYNRAA